MKKKQGSKPGTAERYPLTGGAQHDEEGAGRAAAPPIHDVLRSPALQPGSCRTKGP